MNSKEKEIIKHLRKGKKLNISKIARELNLPVSTVSDRIKRIEDKYVLKRSSLLNFTNIGYYANELLAIKASLQQKEKLLKFLREQNCVNSIFATNMDYSFLIELVCKDHLELVNWIEDLRSRFDIEITSFQILKVEEKEKFMP